MLVFRQWNWIFILVQCHLLYKIGKDSKFFEFVCLLFFPITFLPHYTFTTIERMFSFRKEGQNDIS